MVMGDAGVTALVMVGEVWVEDVERQDPIPT
jgi:hypothetical protein